MVAGDDMREIHIPPFREKLIVPGDIVGIIGKKGSGKTTALLALCYSIRALQEVTLFQKTYDTNMVFHDVIPGLFCHTKWSHAKVAAILKRQTKRNKKRARENKPPIYHTIIVDDFACDKAFVKDQQLEELVMNARHLKITMFFTIQDGLSIHPALRGNLDWVMALKDCNPKSVDRLKAYYFGGLGKRFQKVFNDVTDEDDNHVPGILVLNQKSRSSDPSKCYHCWRAPNRDFHSDKTIRPWKMGSNGFWAFHYQHYDKHHDSESSDDKSQEDGVMTFR